MRYESAQAFRAALDARIRNESDARDLEPGRLRRRVVFERIVARLVAADPDGWIVKGGVALEARLPHRARMTRDLDVAVTTGARDQAAGFADIPPVTATVVDQRQHFAEKLHAFTRDYGDRDNSRVKDLPDMLLLIDNGLAPDAELAGVVEHVFGVRGTHAVPDAIPDPGPAWVERYPREVEHLDVEARTLADAMSMLRAFWAQVREDAA